MNRSLFSLEKIMKTFKKLVISRNLASFRSVFPHDDDTTVENLGEIYDDVLDFSRLVGEGVSQSMSSSPLF
jgi:hypothetical protein